MANCVTISQASDGHLVIVVIISYVSGETINCNWPFEMCCNCTSAQSEPLYFVGLNEAVEQNFFPQTDSCSSPSHKKRKRDDLESLCG